MLEATRSASSKTLRRDMVSAKVSSTASCSSSISAPTVLVASSAGSFLQSATKFLVPLGDPWTDFLPIDSISCDGVELDSYGASRANQPLVCGYIGVAYPYRDIDVSAEAIGSLSAYNARKNGYFER